MTMKKLTLSLLFFLCISLAHAESITGLVGHWSLDEADGTTASDASSNHANATLIGFPADNSQWTTGVNGGGLSMTASRTLSINSSANFNNGLTFAAWIKFDQFGTIISKGSGVAGWMNLQVYINHLWFGKDGATDLGSRTPALIFTGQWYHVAMTWTGQPESSSVSFYINGALVGKDIQTNGVSLIADPNKPIILGPFTGNLDDVYIYNRALSAQEVVDLISPAPPIGLMASSVKTTEVALAWDAIKDPATAALINYTIYRDGTKIGTSTTNSYTDQTALANTKYTYTISAFFKTLPLASSSPSAPVTVTTQPPDLTAPIISDVKVVAYATTAPVTWTTNESSDSFVEYWTQGGSVQLIRKADSVTSHAALISSLTPETAYYFRVKSKDASGNVGVSSDMSFTTTRFIGPTANNITEAGEACDGTDLNGLTCTTVAAGFTGGTLKCKVDRSGYDTSACVAGGNTIHAASCNATDVQAAIDQAVDGDTVKVPAGTCTWTTPVVSGQYSYVTQTYTSKSIVIEGAGIDQTKIIEDIGIQKASAFMLNVQPGKPIRITGFSFDGKKTQDSAASITVTGPPGEPLFRVDHCKFAYVTERGVITNAIYGLIDHNVFLRNPTAGSPTLISVVGDHGYEEDSWTRPQDQGTAHNVYMEDNLFIHNINANGPFDMYDGARYVFRNNDVYGNNLGHHGFDSGTRGMVNFEVYNNQIMNGLPKEPFHPIDAATWDSYFKMYATVGKSDFTTADPSNGAANVAALLSRGVLEEVPEDTTRVRLKNVGIPMPTELQTPMYAYLRIWGILNGSFVHGVVFEFRSGSGLLFNNKVTKTSNATGDTGGYDLFVSLRNYRSGDGYVANMGGTIPWSGNPWNAVCDGTAPMRVAIAASGIGYQVGDVLNIVQTGSSGATVTVTSVNGSGSITGISLTTIGNGYTARDNLPTTGGHGGRARITIGMDGNTPGLHGYPCEDQIGRTSNQALSPVYAWNNDFQGKIGGNMVAGGYATFMCPRGGSTLISKVDKPSPGESYSWVCKDNVSGLEQTLYDWVLFHIVENRDFYNGVAKPGYVPYVYPHPLVQLDDVSAGVYGDVNSDDNITIFDASLVAQFAIGLNPPNFNENLADVSGDGNVNLYDASLIAQYAVGLITKFPKN